MYFLYLSKLNTARHFQSNTFITHATSFTFRPVIAPMLNCTLAERYANYWAGMDENVSQISQYN